MVIDLRLPHPGDVPVLLLRAMPSRSAGPEAPDLILVGGVPGAGKSTAIAVAAQLPGVRALDSDQVRELLRRTLPAGLPYGVYRPLVHTLHQLRVLGQLLRGPWPGGRLVVHGPATRPGRNRVFARLARARGWTPALVYVDVDRATARTGQVRRGRVVRTSAFDAHWRRWQQLRGQLAVDTPSRAVDTPSRAVDMAPRAVDTAPRAVDGFALVEVVPRDQAVATLSRLCTVAPAVSPGRAVRPALAQAAR